MSFLAGSCLLLMDLACLAALAASIGRGKAMEGGGRLGAGLALHIAFLGAGAAWLAGRPWIQMLPLALGMLTPFALFFVTQVLQLQLREVRARGDQDTRPQVGV